MSIDLNKPLQTREGNPVRLLADDGKGLYPIIGIVSFRNGKDKVERWTRRGQYYDDVSIHEEDLVNVPERRTWYAPVYPSNVGLGRPSREECDQQATPRRIGVIEIVTEGTGDNARLVSVTVV